MQIHYSSLQVSGQCYYCYHGDCEQCSSRLLSLAFSVKETVAVVLVVAKLWLVVLSRCEIEVFSIV